MRALASAFNEMQRRIARLIDDRTQALAAVSHDLKTPITRLRFRVDEIADPAARAAAEADLDDMERMIDQTLAYLRGDRADEEIKPVDLVAILETVTGDLADAGRPVELMGAPSVVLPGRRLALKRAFANLIDNALKYGGRASVRVQDEGQSVSITSTTTARAYRRLTKSASSLPSSGSSPPAIRRRAASASGLPSRRPS